MSMLFNKVTSWSKAKKSEGGYVRHPPGSNSNSCLKLAVFGQKSVKNALKLAIFYTYQSVYLSSSFFIRPVDGNSLALLTLWPALEFLLLVLEPASSADFSSWHGGHNAWQLASVLLPPLDLGFLWSKCGFTLPFTLRPHFKIGCHSFLRHSAHLCFCLDILSLLSAAEKSAPGILTKWFCFC